MLVLPLHTDLRLNKLPIITYAIALLCVFIYYQQAENKYQINSLAGQYCQSIHSPLVEKNKFDLLKNNLNTCFKYLPYLHERFEHGVLDDMQNGFSAYMLADYSVSDYAKIKTTLKKHLILFRKNTPDSLDGSLMQFPGEWNPLKYLTSTVAHADWMHLIFNLIFFIAFAPAIEILINNRLKYFFLLVSISFVTCITYSLSVLMSSNEALPTLGLSGVVMGVIGFSAYIMPHAKIRVFVWVLVLIRHYFIPAWILAAWYIGYDTFVMLSSDDYGGTNLIAHVSGGVSGYIIGLIWFKNRRKQIQAELNDEIEYMHAERLSGSSLASYSGGRKALADRQNLKQQKKQYDEYLSRLHQYVQTHRDSQAMALVVAENDIQTGHVEIYEELFNAVKNWGDSRFLLCIGRLIIDLLMQQRKYARALLYIEKCQSISNEFVLANPQNVLLLASLASDAKKYQLAFLLVNDACSRYDNHIDFAQCELMEVKLLWQYLNKVDKAKKRIGELLSHHDHPLKTELVQQLSLMKL